jgi:hypothetical protein
MAPAEVIDLESSDEEPPVKVSPFTIFLPQQLSSLVQGIIDLTIEPSDDEDGLLDISKVLNAANAEVAAKVAAKAAVPTPLNGTPSLPAYIFTIEPSDDEDGLLDIDKVLNAANAKVAAKAVVPPPLLNGTPSLPACIFT